MEGYRAQDDRRWTIFRTIGNSDDNILAGPVVAVGESVEVVPAANVKGAVEALNDLLHAFTSMPDAGLTADDPRYAWWHETADVRDRARRLGSSSDG